MKNDQIIAIKGKIGNARGFLKWLDADYMPNFGS